MAIPIFRMDNELYVSEHSSEEENEIEQPENQKHEIEHEIEEEKYNTKRSWIWGYFIYDLQKKPDVIVVKL